MSETFEKISAVLDGEEPSAGGKVEVFGVWRAPKGYPLQGMFLAWSKECEEHIESESAKDAFDFILLGDISQVTRLKAEVAALQQRLNVADQQNDDLKNAAPVCCVPTVEEKALLAAGDCTPEELWGGPRPTCPKCIGTPVLPAGGDVERFCIYNDQGKMSLRRAADGYWCKHDDVTRLTAENARLWSVNDGINNEFQEAHSERIAATVAKVEAQLELTKAQELLGRVYDADLAARHHQPYNVSKVIDDIESFLANQSAPAANPVFNDPLYNAESDARNAAAMLEEVLELFDDGVGRNAEEFKLMRRIGNWLGRSTPDSEESGDECAHSEANKIGCPECGEVFKR